MKVTRFLVSLMFLSAISTSAFAQGAVSLVWDGCTGPINKQIAPGTPPPGTAMWASVLGQRDMHKSYEVDVTLGSPGGLRDAWRFDAPGCQGTPQIKYDFLSPAKSCPSFQGAAASLQITNYSFDSATGKARAVLANSYPSGSTPNEQIPTTRYFLARFNFDHTYSVNGPGTPGQTCGGLEVPVCAHITKAIWIDSAGLEHAFTVAQEYVTANDPNNSSGCPGATATQAKTWGSVKSQYRN